MAYWNKCKDSRPNNMQRGRDLKWYVSLKSLTHRAQRTLWKRKKKENKNKKGWRTMKKQDLLNTLGTHVYSCTGSMHSIYMALLHVKSQS